MTINSDEQNVYTGNIIGTGSLVKNGTGDLYLIAATDFTGTAIVGEGALEVIESIESVTLEGGIFRGHHAEVRGNLLNLAGVVSAGGAITESVSSPIGMIRVGGDFVNGNLGTTQTLRLKPKPTSRGRGAR